MMIQIADNVASIFNKTQKELINREYKKINKIKESWHFKEFVKISKILKPENIKYCFDLATASYLYSFAFYNENMSNLDYAVLLKSLFENNFKSLKEINFSLEDGLDTLRE